ncbi:MAG: hypothetical protein IJH78_06550 [Clostridia bacterium]|nr:hypothetical protein [Clostridia bacterium]
MDKDLERRNDPQEEEFYDPEESGSPEESYDSEDGYDSDPEEYEAVSEDEDAPAGEEVLSTDMYFNKLMDLLEKQLNSAMRLPRGRGIINLNECLMTLRDMRDNFPMALSISIHDSEERERITQSAAETAKSLIATADERAKKVAERAQKKAQSMIYNAQKDADEIIENARQKAERIVSNDEIVLRAEREASAIVKEAHAKAQDTQLRNSEEVGQMLTDVEEAFRAMLKDIRRMKNDIAPK